MPDGHAIACSQLREADLLGQLHQQRARADRAERRETELQRALSQRDVRIRRLEAQMRAGGGQAGGGLTSAEADDLREQVRRERQAREDAERRLAQSQREGRQRDARDAERVAELVDQRGRMDSLLARVVRLGQENATLTVRCSMLEAEKETAEAALAEALTQLEAAKASEATALAAQAAAEAQLVSSGLARGQAESKKREPPPWVKPNVPAKPKKVRKKRAPEQNGVRKRALEVEPVDHRLERCPDCGQPLAEGTLASTHQVIELPEPPPPPVVREHRVFKAWCSACQKWRQPALDLHAEVVGQGRIGVGLAAFIAYLVIWLRLPVRKVQSYLVQLWGVELSVGEISGVLQRTARSLKPAWKALLEEARAAEVVLMDETPWRENGLGGYIWLVATTTGVRYYYYCHSRARAVVTELLGPNFGGVLVTDFFAVYNGMAKWQQRCWVHLLRDVHALKENFPENEQVVKWAGAVHKLYERGKAAKANGKGEESYAGLVRAVRRVGRVSATRPDHPCRVLGQRLLNFADELFTFVRFADVPPDNNLSERAQRPLVVARKISGGSRSAKGSETRMVLASLFETWHARGLDGVQQCRRALEQAPRFERTRHAEESASDGGADQQQAAA